MSINNVQAQGLVVKGTFGRPPTLVHNSASNEDAKPKTKVGRPRKKPGEEQASKPKGPSPSKCFADHLLNPRHGLWFSESGDQGGSMAYRWNGTYLKPVDTDKGVAVAVSWLDKHFSDKASFQLAVGSWKYADKQLCNERPLPEANPRLNLIPCSDVYLSIQKDGRIDALQPLPEYGMTFALKVPAGTPAGQEHVLQPVPSTSRFLSWLERALPNPDVRALVQEQCGMTLLGTNYQMATWWVGVAGCGKSTLAEICGLMQRQAVSTSLQDLGGDFGMENLLPASLIMIDEVEESKWAEGRFKSLVGQSSMSVRRKGVTNVNTKIRAKWLITSNSRPFVRDRSEGVWRRLCVVDWKVTIPEKERDPDFLETVMKNESHLILTWMLEGAVRMVKRGRFLSESERPAEVQMVKQESRMECDSVRGWANEDRVHTVEGVANYKPKDDIYARYEAWCAISHRDPLMRVQFWRGLRTVLQTVEESNRRAARGTQVKYVNVAWEGPKLERAPEEVVKVDPSAAKAALALFQDEEVPA